LVNSNSLQDCLDAAYYYLSYRQRSEEEVRQWLHKRGFANEVAEKAITKLREQNLSNDFTFAQFWKDNRLSFRPKSKRLIKKELRDKKVAAEIVEQVTKDIDDEEIAYKLGSGRMPALAHLDYPDFYRRLSSYLAYRGFSYEVIKRAASLLWQERKQG
jgi:regulatory protein